MPTEPFYHWSEKPIEAIKTCEPDATATYDDKPCGLWLSYGEEWKGFLLDAGWVIPEHKYEVKLNSDSPLLWINEPKELDAFHKIFSKPGKYHDSKYYDIAWKDVAQFYHGIIIAPYIYERRHTYSWYYGWDIASGCIWNADAITSIEEVEHEQAA